MMKRAAIVGPALLELAELHAARDRAMRSGDIVTALALGGALRRALERRRTGQVAKRRLRRRPALA